MTEEVRAKLDEVRLYMVRAQAAMSTLNECSAYLLNAVSDLEGQLITDEKSKATGVQCG